MQDFILSADTNKSKQNRDLSTKEMYAVGWV